ncbi:MAG: beta-galactosidase trimerization domain-containing protein, partial [Chloroflexota bacterium]|nr:beta-galactosidase trimerization domain-containing protein [Chloroflexota bacterium]
APCLRWRDEDESIMTADGFNDILQVTAPGVDVLAEYAEGYYAGAPALVRNTVGNGSAYYYGAVFNVDSAQALLRHMGLASPVGDWLELPRPVELCIRERAATGERIIFLLNYSDAEQTIMLQKAVTDLLVEEQVQGEMVLPPYGVRMFAETDETPLASR